MKFVKKMLAVLSVIAMLAAMLVTTASAADITITINNPATGHTYEAYQVFKGDLNASGVLSNVEWGNGVNGDNLLAALKASELFKKGDTNMFAGAVNAEGVAQVITGWPYNERDIKNFADIVAANLTDTKKTSADQVDGKYVITLDSAGYYFIKDAGKLGAEGATDYLLQISKSTEISPKASAPTFDKSVNNVKDGTFTKAMDAQVGDVVWFKLEAHLPSLLNDYKQFYAKFEDTLPAGLVPEEGSSSGNIYIEHANGSKTALTAEIARSTNDGDQITKVTLNLGDIKTQLGNVTLNLNDKIIIKYSAKVTSAAVYGQASGLGNGNQAVFTFSNNMNDSGTDGYSTAALKSSASVYVYQAEFTKVDSVTKAPLQGAEFHLYRNVVKTEDSATTTVKSYAVIEDGVITGWTETVPTEPKLVSGEDGKFVVKGLDALTYHLEEVKSPDGYNKMKEDVLVTITSTITGQALTGLSMKVDGVTVNGTVGDGLVTGQINNTAGTTLPTTGGMGTTIFYIVGIMMVLGAGVAFVVKKRNEA